MPEISLPPTAILRTDVKNTPDTPRPGASREGKGMSDADFQSFVFKAASEARLYAEERLAEDRATATDYYKGRLPDVDIDDANEDRSMAVLSDVRDTVLGMLPDLLRIFFGSDGVVEYRPAPSSDTEEFAKNQEQAKQATDYVQNIVLKTDNPDFFMTAYSVFKDALVRKTGFVGWRWETNKKPVYTHHTGLTQDTVELLAADDDIEITSKSTTIIQDPILGPSVLYDVTLKRIQECGRARIQGIPCENMIVSGYARSEDDARLIGYTDDLEVGEFLDRGLIDDIDELDGSDYDPSDRDSAEAQARRPGNSPVISDDAPPEDKASRKVKYGELYVRCDRDGDGIAELRRVITAGTSYKVLEDEPWDEVDFAAFCPYPEAYEFFGESVADLTMDIQRMKSRIMRDMLDSLAQSVKPQMGVVEGQVNLDDVLNPDTSNVIRMRGVGMVQPILVPFVGKEAAPVLDILTRIRENRTGMTDAAAGLDAKSLQSTDNDAVQNTLTKGEGRVEMIARVFIETGFKRLFRGVLKLITKHQTEKRILEIHGRPQIVDPRLWNSDMHVEPALPLGRGGQQAQMVTLGGIMSKQEQILQTLGPDNPFVTMGQYYFTLAKMCEVAGWRNVGSFFTDPASMPPEQLAQIKQAMTAAMAAKAGGGAGSQPTGPDPQTERLKITSNEKVKMAELQQKQAEMAAEMQMRSAEMQSHMQIEVIKATISHSTAVDTANIQGMIKNAGDQIAAATKIAVEKLKPRGGADNGGSSTAANG